MITAIIQARYSSTRLPGKVLLPLGDRTVLEQVVGRVSQAKAIARILVATSVQTDDDKIFQLCQEKGIECFRGSLEDVLDRYYQAAKKFNAENICRITADCPLIDPEIIDKVAEKFLEGGFDYISTGRLSSTLPDGMDTEIFTFDALEIAWKEAKLSSEREHVTPYIWKNPDTFKIFTLENDVDLSNYRLTLDEEKDYLLLQEIFKNVKELTLSNVLNYIDSHSSAKELNANVMRDEGYYKSLKRDNNG